MKQLLHNTLLFAVMIMCVSCSKDFTSTDDSPTISISDSGFWNFLVQNFDLNGDGRISIDEAELWESMSIYENNVKKIDGLRYFKSLMRLSCSNTSITSLDSLRQLSSLKHLDVNSNNLLSKFDASGCSTLTWIDFRDNRQVTIVDVSNCPALETFIFDPQGTTPYSLNISGCISLYGHTYIYGDKELPGYGIHEDYCQHLKAIGMAVAEFSLQKNKILESVDLSESKIQHLHCHDNPKLTSLNLNKCNMLTNISIQGNGSLETIDFSGCTQLEDLWLGHNPVYSSLNLNGKTALKRVDCYNNAALVSLDVSGCEQLEYLRCDESQLYSLNISGCKQLRDIVCRGNSLSPSAMNQIYNDLPQRPDNDKGSIYVDRATAGDYHIAEDKGWGVSLW